MSSADEVGAPRAKGNNSYLERVPGRKPVATPRLYYRCTETTVRGKDILVVRFPKEMLANTEKFQHTLTWLQSNVQTHTVVAMVALPPPDGVKLFGDVVLRGVLSGRNLFHKPWDYLCLPNGEYMTFDILDAETFHNQGNEDESDDDTDEEVERAQKAESSKKK